MILFSNYNFEDFLSSWFFWENWWKPQILTDLYRFLQIFTDFYRLLPIFRDFYRLVPNPLLPVKLVISYYISPFTLKNSILQKLICKTDINEFININKANLCLCEWVDKCANEFNFFLFAYIVPSYAIKFFHAHMKLVHEKGNAYFSNFFFLKNK